MINFQDDDLYDPENDPGIRVVGVDADDADQADRADGAQDDGIQANDAQAEDNPGQAGGVLADEEAAAQANAALGGLGPAEPGERAADEVSILPIFMDKLCSDFLLVLNFLACFNSSTLGSS